MTESELIKHLYKSGLTAFEYALELSQRDEWQDISTAPKDGTEIWVYDKTYKSIMISFWDQEFKRFNLPAWVVTTPLYWSRIPSPPKGDL